MRERGGKEWRRLEFLLRLILGVNPRFEKYVLKCFFYYFFHFGMKIENENFKIYA